MIGITGTTSGIGSALCRLPYSFVKFDRKDGDIHDVERVYEKLKDCDVFINNAWDGDCQTKLLKFFFDKWEHQEKKIISIGSSVASYTPTGQGYNDYVEFKRQLRQAHCDIVDLKTTRCKSYLVNPGVTDTKMTAGQDRKKMTVQDVAEMVRFVLDNKLYIPEVYFYVE
jgi:NAD(P)-dependent dehydrogenase (short-subunit alcohol dehydrogenase family)